MWKRWTWGAWLEITLDEKPLVQHRLLFLTKDCTLLSSAQLSSGKSMLMQHLLLSSLARNEIWWYLTEGFGVFWTTIFVVSGYCRSRGTGHLRASRSAAWCTSQLCTGALPGPVQVSACNHSYTALQLHSHVQVRGLPQQALSLETSYPVRNLISSMISQYEKSVISLWPRFEIASHSHHDLMFSHGDVVLMYDITATSFIN